MFRKYPSITNHYQTEWIQKFLNVYPELEKTTYIITEKLHGSNIQLVFQPNVEMLVCTRNRILPDGENFFNIFNVLKDYQDEIDKIQKYTDEYIKNTLGIYGEIFGPGICKGIDYGDKKQIRFFDMYIGDVLLSQSSYHVLLDILNIRHLTVPELGKVTTLREALDFDCEGLTKINPVEGNISEGIVIKPEKVYYNLSGELFYIKKKNEKFIEKAREPKPLRELDEFDFMNELFKTYITKARIENVYSKEGRIDDHKDIGKYIVLIMNDAKEEFTMDHSIDGITKPQLKRVFNVGHIIANLLKEEL